MTAAAGFPAFFAVLCTDGMWRQLTGACAGVDVQRAGSLQALRDMCGRPGACAVVSVEATDDGLARALMQGGLREIGSPCIALATSESASGEAAVALLEAGAHEVILSQQCSAAVLTGAAHRARWRYQQELAMRIRDLGLAARHAELRALLTSAPLGVAVFDRRHRYVYVNDVLAQINGLAAADHLGKTIEELLPVNAAAVGPVLDQVFATGVGVGNVEVTGETPRDPGVLRHWLTGFFPVRDETAAITAVGAWGTEISESRRIQDALRRSDERLRLALAASQTGLWTWNVRTGVVDWSPETYRLLGLTRAEFGGTAEAFFSLVHEDDRQAVRASVRAAIERRTVYAAEFRVRGPEGRQLWVSNRGQATYGDDGEPLEVVGTVTDVTERRLAQEALRESEEEFRSTFDNAAVGIAHVALDGRWLRLNDRLCAITGYSRKELQASDFQSITHPADLPADLALCDKVIAGEIERYSIEKRYIAKGGAEVWVNLTVAARRGPRGEPLYFISVVEDISARKRSEQALHAALEASRTGTFRWDIKSGELQWDAALAQLFGLAPGETVRDLAGFLGRVHPEDREKVRQACSRCMNEGTDFEEEFRVVLADRTHRWLYDRGRTFRDTQGHPSHMTGACVDVTRSKVAEAALREADQQKDQFLATLAHELRNPLAPLKNSVEILRRRRGRKLDVEQVAGIMERQIGHMVRMVDDLLDVSRISSGKIRLHKQRCALQAPLTDAVEAARPLMEAKGHVLTVDWPEQPLWTEADPTRIAQVLTNLLNNAAKYTPPRGSIAVQVRSTMGEAAISVSDNGAGLDAHAIQQVFGLFVQVEHTKAYAQGGLGIGLAVVKKLVEMHGGRVEVHSPGIGHGSTFTVFLPLLQSHGQEDVGSTASGQVLPLPVAGNRVRRVLVVDDNSDGAQALSTMLQLLGHETRTVSDASLAEDESLRFAPHLVLLDIGMPRMDGYEVARRLRTHSQLASTLLVALTGFATEQARQRSRDAGFDVHLTKPLDLEQVQALLTRVDHPPPPAVQGTAGS